LRRWWAPAAQAASLVLIVLVGTVRIDAARADIAADSGAGRVVAVQSVTRRAAPPVVLGIPRLGLTSRLVGLRKQRNGQLQVPADPQRAGWYSEGSAPGDPGPAVIVGHVDSYRGPGVFARLATLRKGDLVRVRRADGSPVTFEVRLVRTYSKRSFPTELVYVGDGRPSLRLITCGGAFDRRTGHYLSNTVVFAAEQKPKATPVRGVT
jgi:hypothetical protein